MKMNTFELRRDRFIRICKWARDRYNDGKWITISVGGNPSIYSRICEAAWDRYMAGGVE